MSEHINREGCAQCGSAEIKKIGKDKYECAYCGCVYKVTTPKVFIGRGAKVTFSGNVDISGGLEVGEGADVHFHDQVEILEEGFRMRKDKKEVKE